MYKQAVILDLKFQTPKGLLIPQQLYQLTMTDLTTSIKAVKRILKKNDDDELSFLEDTKTVDVENQLRFDILKDVYLTKKQKLDEARNAAEVKAHNQKILTLIAEKKDESLRNMPVEELEKLLK
jgi:hypothetical protein